MGSGVGPRLIIAAFDHLGNIGDFLVAIASPSRRPDGVSRDASSSAPSSA
jgi:hypothetical protein